LHYDGTIESLLIWEGEPLSPVYWLLLGFFFIAVYYFNSLVSLKVRARNAWADVDVQLKRRYDLIPNLVEVVKGYAAHEKNLLQRVTELRARAAGTDGAEGKAVAEAEFSGVLSKLLVIVENYPDLKADRQFLDLQKNLSAVENDLSHARRYYNAVVRDYNTLIRKFPPNLIAGMFRFESLAFFEVGEGERGARRVDFSGNATDDNAGVKS
jgi:LemA protein